MTIIRTLALFGFGVSAYLVWMKLTGQITSVVGCGGEGGCSNVLGSQWSQWVLIPVSVVSACFYLGLIVLSYKVSKSILTMAAFLLIMTAAWFMGLQVFVIKSFCPWCFTTHLIGLFTAGAIFWKARAPFKPTFIMGPLLLMTLLILGQIYGPKPKSYAFTSEAGIEKREEVKAHNEGKGRVVDFKDATGRVVKTYRLGSVPLIGSPDAKHILVKYFDYTCQSCRTMEKDLAVLMQTYPGQVAVIVLPTPLNRACNPYVSAGNDHEHACELARLGLAFWPVGERQHLLIHTSEGERVGVTCWLELTRLGVHHHQPFRLRLTGVVRDDSDTSQDDGEDEDTDTSDKRLPLTGHTLSRPPYPCPAWPACSGCSGNTSPDRRPKALTLYGWGLRYVETRCSQLSNRGDSPVGEPCSFPVGKTSPLRVPPLVASRFGWGLRRVVTAVSGLRVEA